MVCVNALAALASASEEPEEPEEVVVSNLRLLAPGDLVGTINLVGTCIQQVGGGFDLDIPEPSVELFAAVETFQVRRHYSEPIFSFSQISTQALRWSLVLCPLSLVPIRPDRGFHNGSLCGFKDLGAST